MAPTLDNLPPNRHRVYGLTVATWIPFPELESAPADAPVDEVKLRQDVLALADRLTAKGLLVAEPSPTDAPRA